MYILCDNVYVFGTTVAIGIPNLQKLTVMYNMANRYLLLTNQITVLICYNYDLTIGLITIEPELICCCTVV